MFTKKKKTGLQSESSSVLSIFVPKFECSLKEKEIKVFTRNQAPNCQFLSESSLICRLHVQ